MKARVFEKVVPVYQTLANDEQDSVRSLAVSSSGSLGCALGLDGDLCAKAILPVVGAGSIDLSWYARFTLFHILCYLPHLFMILYPNLTPFFTNNNNNTPSSLTGE